MEGGVEQASSSSAQGFCGLLRERRGNAKENFFGPRSLRDMMHEQAGAPKGKVVAAVLV
jgi:hypothetical protein